MVEHYDVIGYDIRKVNTTVKLSSSLQQAVDDRDIVFWIVQTIHDSTITMVNTLLVIYSDKDFNYDIPVIEAIKEIDKYVSQDYDCIDIDYTIGTVRNKDCDLLVKNGRFIYNFPYLIIKQLSNGT